MAIEVSVVGANGIFVGEDKTLDFTIYEDDGVTPQDITGWQITFLMRQRREEGPIVYQAVATIITPASGTCRVDFPATATVDLAYGTYFIVLRRTDEDANTVLSYGELELLAAPPSPV